MKYSIVDEILNTPVVDEILDSWWNVPLVTILKTGESITNTSIWNVVHEGHEENIKR